jgi:general secretion pathway protein G
MRIFKRKWSVVSGQWSEDSDQLRVESGQKFKNSSPLITHHSSLTTGFTLIELMAVIAIILLLASIMIPNVVKNVERGREAKAKADIDILVKAVSLFQIDNGRLPKGDLSELWGTIGQGPYISTDQTKSLETPWGGSYSLTDEGNSFTITATGSDKTTIKVSKKITFE